MFVIIFGYIVQHLLKVPGRSPTFPLLAVGALCSLLAATFMIVGMPAFTFAPRATARTNTYEGLAAQGRKVYLREGCWYCHTQFVRPQDRDFGPVSEAPDFVNDDPHVLGTERTGPDLSNIGSRGFPDNWFYARLYNPRTVFPGSLMAPFPFLFDGAPDKPGEDAKALVAYLQTLGKNRQKFLEDEQLGERFMSIPVSFREKRTTLGISWGSVGTGAGIFQQNCLPCHGPLGRGDGPAGKIFTKRPADFRDGRFDSIPEDYAKPYGSKKPEDQFNAFDQYLFWRISTGVPGTQMPEWGRGLSEEQRWNLVNYVRYLAGRAPARLLPGPPPPAILRQLQEAQKLSPTSPVPPPVTTPMTPPPGAPGNP